MDEEFEDFDLGEDRDALDDMDEDDLQWWLENRD